MEHAYLEWEDAARRADNAEQAVARITRLGLPAPLKLLDQLASLESELLVKLHALQNPMPIHPVVLAAVEETCREEQKMRGKAETRLSLVPAPRTLGGSVFIRAANQPLAGQVRRAVAA